MQTLSPQPTISSLSIPKKPTAFFKNPLDRPELGPSLEHPLVSSQPIVSAAVNKPSTGVVLANPHEKSALSGESETQTKNPAANAPTPENSTSGLSWEKHLPSSWKPENNPPLGVKTNVPIPNSTPVIAAENKNAVAVVNRESVLPSATPTRRKLPDEIKKIFETTSKDFATYAKNGEKNTEQNNEKNDALALNNAPDKMDEWDRALLLGEYMPNTLERQKPKRLSFVPPSSFIPKKTDARQSGTVFPSRVMDEGITSPVPRVISHSSVPPTIPMKPASVLTGVSNEVVDKKVATSPAITVPLKPKQPILNIPHPPSVPVHTDTRSAPPPNMSETLIEKIIEGQMRGVFENAPPLLQKELEKTAAREIMITTGEKAPGGNIENEVWKKRLREYLAKLHEQAIAVFPDTKTASPIDGEFVLDYVKRVYPILLKMRVMK